MEDNGVEQNATNQVDAQVSPETLVTNSQVVNQLDNQVSEGNKPADLQTNQQANQEEKLDSLYDFDDLKYDFSAVKNSNGENYNQTTVDFVTTVAKEMKLNNEQAGSLLKILADNYQTVQQQTVQRERTNWRAELRSDPELGGENFDKTRLHLSTVMRKFGNNEVKDILNSTGLGDHPAFVRMFNAIGASMSQEVNVIKGTQPKPKFDYNNYFYNTK